MVNQGQKFEEKINLTEKMHELVSKVSLINFLGDNQDPNYAK